MAFWQVRGDLAPEELPSEILLANDECQDTVSGSAACAVRMLQLSKFELHGGRAQGGLGDAAGSRSGALTQSEDVPRRLKIVNGCNDSSLWIAHEAGAKVGPGGQDLKIEPGGVLLFPTPNGLSATRYWAKMGCDEHGSNCQLGDSGGPGEACIKNPVTGDIDYSRCAPPVDTKFEATFGQHGLPCNPKAEGGKEMKGCDYIDLSLVDGYTLPVKLDIDGDCKGSKEESVDMVDCSKLNLTECPTAELLSAAGITVDLQVVNPISGQVVGCYSPCMRLLDTKWSNKDLVHSRTAEESSVAPYCCPTPPESPESCRAGPIKDTKFLEAVHSKCPGVYGYAYDDGIGLMRCSAATTYTLTFYCPAKLP
eukprot:CAMPEP_0115096610 /NCGR_PEP_ID=MMETSP0227-20121206/29838_1 /TAXON_ID=89957 /ORGANISM="Polarella glacialis, Strain CCMP 1383" /LENGTH=365 /DNA_ID=CAMNT_0002490401 /DNA_START=116 /DNA_END=1213 /DNA_ORIENTATION=-